MARRFENECVGCPPEKGCLGSACPNRNVPYYTCDSCGDDFEPEELYIDEDDGCMYCAPCMLSRYKTVADTLGWDCDA